MDPNFDEQELGLRVPLMRKDCCPWVGRKLDPEPKVIVPGFSSVDTVPVCGKTVLHRRLRWRRDGPNSGSSTPGTSRRWSSVGESKLVLRNQASRFGITLHFGPYTSLPARVLNGNYEFLGIIMNSHDCRRILPGLYYEARTS